jgi:Fe-S cluster assembly protein SufD
VLLRKGISGLSYAHHVVEIGANAKATLVIDHAGLIQVAANIEFIVGDGASLSVVAVNSADEGSIQLSTYAALIGRDAFYRHVNITLGGSVVRIVPTVRFAGPGGSAELLGVSFAGEGQHFEGRLFVDHNAPNCTSSVLYKNALLGQSARTVWIGDVRIRPAATGTSTYEMNRNLLLSDGARADSVPNLEIETGDIIGAGHASATGRFDDLQLFYLQSRGIPEEEARRLVVRGFFADVVERIGVPEMEHRIMTAIEARLGFTPELESTE